MTSVFFFGRIELLDERIGEAEILHARYGENGEPNREGEKRTKAADHVVDGAPHRLGLPLDLVLMERIAQIGVVRLVQAT